MQLDFIEHRRHFRVYFKGDGEFLCRLGISADDKVQARVLDLSLGGIHLALDGEHPVEVGNRLQLGGFLYRDGYSIDENVVIEVRWVFRSSDFSNVYLGCEFQSLPEPLYSYFAKLIGVKIQEKKRSDSICSN